MIRHILLSIFFSTCCICAGFGADVVSCNAGYYWDGATCAECGGNEYYCPGFSDVANPSAGYGRNAVEAGYYSTGGTATTRTGQSQCTGTTYCTDGEQYECPDAETHKRTTFPDNYYDATITSIWIVTGNGKSEITRCSVGNWMQTTRGKLFEYNYYNPSTSKYDITYDYGWSDTSPGYYLVSKSGCGTYAYYKEIKECPAGSYCPGKTRVECDASNQSTVHTETFGLETCPTGAYCPANSAAPTACPDGTVSPAGSTSADACKSPEYPFNITTTDMAAGTEFSFIISASGSFWVDWGDGSAVQTITRTDTNAATYSHTYSTAGVYTIQFGGLATGYTTLHTNAAIIFYDNKYIAGISGSLGAIFPTLGTADGQIPIFIRTFYKCTNLSGSIPADLFRGVTGKALNMFTGTFAECSNLSGSIPAGLFSGITGRANNMFGYTFDKCSSLSGEIPAGLFSGITGSAASMFSGTFRGCTGLTGSIPADLFRGVTGSADYMFGSTFNGCSNLVGPIPAGLFSGISGSADYMFGSTFWNCGKLSGPIPAGVFRGVTGSASGMFAYTFYGCSGLSGSIPADLFSGVTGSASGMFHGTFRGCTGLTGEIPSDLFASVTGSASGMFDSTFAGCSKLSGPIPAGLFPGVTGSADRMFLGTFMNCGKLSGPIPAGLFRGVTGSAPSMFQRTFNGCSKLSGEIPADLFRGVTGSAEYMFRETFRACSGLTGYVPAGMFPDNTTGASEMYTDTFSGASKMDTSCPANMYDTPPVGAESWTVAVCNPCPDGTISPAGSTSADTCHACTGNYVPNTDLGMCQITCQPGTYLAAANADACTNVGAGFWAAQSVVNYGDVSARNACPDNLTTIGYGPGADSADDCGKILHIGDEKIYLRSVKKTSPALAVGVGDKTFYANMSTVEHNLTAGSRRFLKSDYKNSIYYIYDDTAENR